jgi:hypothetical protein
MKAVLRKALLPQLGIVDVIGGRQRPRAKVVNAAVPRDDRETRL